MLYLSFKIKRLFSSQVLNDDETMKVPCFKTFCRAFKERKDVSLSRKKGNFSTCELCLTATDLLMKCKNEPQRKLIESYKSKHLNQQFRQRDGMDAAMREAELSTDSKGIKLDN